MVHATNVYIQTLATIESIVEPDHPHTHIPTPLLRAATEQISAALLELNLGWGAQCFS